MAQTIKFKKLLKEVGIFDDDEQEISIEAKKVFLDEISKYNEYGKDVYHSGNIIEVAKKLNKLAELAERITLSEAGDWFDRITISRNMKELKGLVKEFNKVAVDEQAMRDRLSALYEDIGNLLGRYYEIKELNEEDYNKNKCGECKK